MGSKNKKGIRQYPMNYLINWVKVVEILYLYIDFMEYSQSIINNSILIIDIHYIL